MNTRPALRALLAILAIVAAACGGGGESASVADLVHVHGLAQDDSSDGLLIATHTGLFTLQGQTVSRVGDNLHDLMGFTVAGPGDYLASGHPDLQHQELRAEGKPPLLGLIGSPDGQSWDALSLLGDVDFHSLEAAHGRVYGAPSAGGFMVTEDRENWTNGATIDLFDFAVSPDDPDVVVGTGPEGLVRTTDSGRTWRPLNGPGLLFLDWDDQGLVGVTPTGAVSTSSDDGDAWTQVGSVEGQPQAVLATGDRVVVAVAERGIFASTDRGATFVPLITQG